MESAAKVHIHPVVLMSIVDAYERRNEDSERVIGTLLGTFERGIIEITHCFAVPYKEGTTDVQMDLEFANFMLQLERKVNRNQRTVGWYATGNEITEHSKLIHEDYYMQHVKNAIFLLVDTTFAFGDKLGVKAYQGRSVGIPGGTRGILFMPLEVDIEYYEAEQCAVEMMASTINPRSKVEPQFSDDLIHLYHLTGHLQSMLEQVIVYVEQVIRNERTADNNIGRALSQLIFSMPKLDTEHLENLVNSSFKDLLMVTYLTNLIRTHLKLLNLTHT